MSEMTNQVGDKDKVKFTGELFIQSGFLVLGSKICGFGKMLNLTLLHE